MAPSLKKCKGCGTSVANPVTCPRCDIVSHPACLGRTGHPWQNGSLLNCGPCLSGSAVVDADVTGSQSVMPQPSFPTVDTLMVMMRELIRDELVKFRQEMVSSIRSELADLKAMTSDLDERVRQLEQNSSCVNVQQSSGPIEMDGIMAEMHDRHARAKNLIIRGFPGVA